MARSVEIARAFITLETETKGLDQQLSQVERSLGRVAKFVKDNPVVALTGLGTAAIAAGFALAKMAEDTNKAIGIIADRVPGATGKIAEMRAEVNRLAFDFAISQDKVIATMDAASRAGVKNGQDLISVTTAAIAAGRAIGEDGASLIGGLDAALKIFGIDGQNSTAVMVEFLAAAKGRTDVDALLDTVTKLAPAVAGTGLSFETTLSAVTQLLNEGFAPGKKLIAEFNREIKEGGVPAIEALAAKAPLAADAVQTMTDAIKRNTETIEGENARAQASLKAQLVELGTILEPIAAKLVGFVVNLAKYFHGVDVASLAATEGAMAADKAAAAAGLTANTSADAFKALGVSGGVAAGGAGELAGKLLEIKNASSDLGHSSVADLTRYKTTLEAASAAGKLDAEGSKLLTKVTEELTKKRKEEGDAALKAAKDILESRKILLELEQKYSDTVTTLAESQANAIEAIEVDFQEKILKLKGDAKAKALALLAETKARTVEAWTAIGHAINDEYIPTAKATETEDAKLSKAHSDLALDVIKGSGAYEEIIIQMDAATKKQKAHREAIAETAIAIARGADEMGNFLHVLGLADEKTDALVTGIGDLAEGISKIAKGDIFGGILEGLGGLGKAIGGLFGESAAEKHLREALDKNRNTLEELSRHIGDLNIALTGNQLSGSTEALKEFFSTGGALSKGWGDRLGAALLKRGLTIEDLDQVAKTLQIELRPNGHLDPNALNQLMQALGLIEPTQFGTDFKGQRDKLRHEAGLFNETAAQQGTALAGLGGSQLKGATASAIGGLDFASQTGRDAALKTLQGLFTNLPNIPVSELGGLQPAEFLQLLEDLKSLIETANQDAASTAGSPPPGGGPTTNPNPSGLSADPLPVDPIADPVFTPNLEASNWEELLGLERRVPDLLTQILGKLDFTPIEAPPLPSGVLGSIPGPSGGATITFNGDFNLVAQPGQNGVALFEQFLEILRDPRAAEAIDGALGPRYQDALSLKGNITRSLL